MSLNFVILEIAKDARTQIILGRPFLAPVGYEIDVKEDLSFSGFFFCNNLILRSTKEG